MKLEVGASTHVGKIKKENEDAILAKVGENDQGELGIFVVADGVSSLEGSRYASQRITTLLNTYWYQVMPYAIKNEVSMLGILEHLSEQVEKENERLRSLEKSVGTTLSTLLLLNNTWGILHVGDSRIYQMFDSKLKLLTEDHTVANYLVKKGEIGCEEMKTHPKRHVLTQCIGASEVLQLESLTGELKETMVFLICSDGLYEEIEDVKINKVITKVHRGILTCQQGVDMLLREVLRKEAKDNTSIILVKCQGEMV